jgi:hypothetical protein
MKFRYELHFCVEDLEGRFDAHQFRILCDNSQLVDKRVRKQFELDGELWTMWDRLYELNDFGYSILSMYRGTDAYILDRLSNSVPNFGASGGALYTRVPISSVEAYSE